jgi:CBS domain containing-hemolysin-like protein
MWVETLSNNLEIVAILSVTITISFVCSLSEAVLLSVPSSYISVLIKNGRKSGLLLEQYREQVDQPLVAILTMNTVANTMGSMLLATQVMQAFGDPALATATAVATIGILIFGEIAPKTIGAQHAKRLAPLVARSIQVLMLITYPIVSLSRLLNRLFNVQPPQLVTREEMIATAEMGVDEGVIHQKESRIIKNLLMLEKIPVSEVMTPRSVVDSFDMNMTVEEILEKYKPVRFSRIPLFDGSPDNIKGLLHRFRLMEAVSHDQQTIRLSAIMTPIHFVQDSVPVSQVLDLFIKQRDHLFAVKDSNNDITGIVTLEDAIETLLGVEIVDAYDKAPDMRLYALEQWRKKRTPMN